jgi:VanZ family protein
VYVETRQGHIVAGRILQYVPFPLSDPQTVPAKRCLDLVSIVHRLAFAAYVAMIVVLSIIPPGPRVESLRVAADSDKMEHLGVYMLMGLLGMSLTASRQSAVRMFLFIAFIGAATEGLQALVLARTANPVDFVYNSAGAIVGTLVWLGVNNARQRSRKRAGN